MQEAINGHLQVVIDVAGLNHITPEVEERLMMLLPIQQTGVLTFVANAIEYNPAAFSVQFYKRMRDIVHQEGLIEPEQQKHFDKFNLVVALSNLFDQLIEHYDQRQAVHFAQLLSALSQGQFGEPDFWDTLKTTVEEKRSGMLSSSMLYCEHYRNAIMDFSGQS